MQTMAVYILPHGVHHLFSSMKKASIEMQVLFYEQYKSWKGMSGTKWNLLSSTITMGVKADCFCDEGTCVP